MKPYASPTASEIEPSIDELVQVVPASLWTVMPSHRQLRLFDDRLEIHEAFAPVDSVSLDDIESFTSRENSRTRYLQIEYRSRRGTTETLHFLSRTPGRWFEGMELAGIRIEDAYGQRDSQQLAYRFVWTASIISAVVFAGLVVLLLFVTVRTFWS